MKAPAIFFTTHPRDCTCTAPGSRATTGQGLRVGHSGDCPARCTAVADYDDNGYTDTTEVRCDLEWNHRGEHTSADSGVRVRWSEHTHTSLVAK